MKEEKGELLRVKDLSISFHQYDRGLRRRTLCPVRGLSATIRSGELTAVAGVSGSGKSLLAHGVMGLLPYNAAVSGELYYKGELLTSQRVRKLRGREIALIPQGVSGLDPLIRTGSQITGGKRGKEAADRCDSLLRRYGLPQETKNLYPSQLSGGMARRALIAGAMMSGPELIIADEPTPGLEEETALRVMGHFREMAAQGAGVLCITHDLELALMTADRILIFWEGRVVEELLPEEIFRGKLPSHPYARALLAAIPGRGRKRAAEAERAGGRQSL